MAAIEAGFARPVEASQSVFHAVMQALSRPGRIATLGSELTPPSPLTPELAALALTLADQDAPVWLDAPLAASDDVQAFLRFHTGAPIVTDPSQAAFALVSAARDLPDLADFAQGTDAYPDRSTTLIVAVEALATGEGLRLRGPGIKGEASLRIDPLPEDFARQFGLNRGAFPCGVDLVFVAAGAVAALPRSSMIVQEA